VGKIPEEYLPPKEFLPDKVYTLPEIHYPQKLNLAKVLLDDNIPKYADKVAVYYKDKKLTYKELQERVNRFSNALKSLGVEKK